MERFTFLVVASVIMLVGCWDVPTVELQKREFIPNFIAIEDAPILSLQGERHGEIKQRTIVSVMDDEGEFVDVMTQEGERGLAKRGAFSRLGSTIPIDQTAKQASESSNRFAFDLYQQARQKEGNLFLSPASISTALAMTYAGANGRTQQEMADVLHFKPDQKVHAGFSTLLLRLNSTGEENGYSLSTANRLWGASDARFEDPFLKLTSELYGAELETVDFAQSEQTRRQINQWVEDQTRKKITNLISAGVLDSDTRLVLTNAIYFEGGWSAEFDKEETKLLPFQISASETASVPMMRRSAEVYAYTEDETVQVLSMPYRRGDVSMIVVLPKSVDGLDDVESKLTSEQFANWMKELRPKSKVDVQFPKFTMRSELML